MQISGKKCWKLFDSPFPLPLSNQPISKEDSSRYLTEIPKAEIELSPGDLLYIPRGYVHDAFTKDTSSIHITLGLFPNKRIDLLKIIIEKAS